MSEYNSQNILFVVNPVAGGGVNTNIEQEVSSCFSNNKYTCQYKIYNTTGDNDAEQIAKLIDEQQPSKVIVAGGDGTIKMVATQLLNTEISLGIIPTGSANGMATELNLPLDISDSIDVAMNGIVKHMDILKINQEDICLHLSDIGMNAQVVKYYQENNWRGKLGYLRGAIKTLLNKKQMQLTITGEGEPVHRSAFMVVLANASMYGTKVVINPDGSIYDGEFELVIIKEVSFIEILKMIFRLTNYNPEVIESIKAKTVEITVKKNIYFQVDGEYKGKTNSICAKVEKGALPIILPA